MLDYLRDFFIPKFLFERSFLYSLILSALVFILIFVIHYLRHERKVRKLLLGELTKKIFPDYVGELQSEKLKIIFKEKAKEIEVFEKELLRADAFTTDPVIYYVLGNYNLMKDRFQRALEYFKKAKELDPKMKMTTFGIGVSLMKIGKYNEAIDAFKESITLGEKVADSYYNIGWAYDELGKYDEAIKAYKKSYGYNSEDYWNNYNIACSLAKMGRYDEAINTLREIINKENVKNTARGDTDFQKLKTDTKFGPIFSEIIS